MQNRETFIMDDSRSTRKLTRNTKGEENSAHAYRIFMLKQLRKHGGVMTRDELEEALLRNYEHTFGPEDRRRIGKRLKWQNSLDWAKAVAASKGEVATRSKTKNKVRTTYIVLLDPAITPQDWIDWASAKKKKNGFRKKCPKCGRKVPLGWKVCRTVRVKRAQDGTRKKKRCRYEFPKQNRRIDRIPR
jgi:hypothetical protein